MFTRFLAPGVRRAFPAAMLALSLLAPATAVAQTSAAERAAQLNDEGKKLWLEDDDLPGAVKKFRQATMLAPEGRYYFNLCYALHQLGRYREALTACEAVEPNGADQKLLEKTNVVIEDLRQRLPPAPDEGTPPDTGGGAGTDPDTDPNYDPDTDPGYDPDTGYGQGTGQDPAGGEPGYGGEGAGQGYGSEPPPGPLPGLTKETGPKDDYRWAIGGELGFVGSSLGEEGYYGSGGGILKLHADVMWLSSFRLGAEGYIHISQLTPGDDERGFTDSLEIVDFGVALFKHIPFRNLYMTPLVGVHLSGLQPGSFIANPVVKAGLRADFGFAWLLGKDRTHAISVTPSIKVYSATTGPDAVDNGLEDGGVTVALTAGYTMRFTTPFGRVPFITLE